MKTFLDVGGHRGETLQYVLANARFDLVHCFEPIPHLCDFIKNKFADDIASGKLQVHNFGLADFTGEQKLYGVGVSASLFSDKRNVDKNEFMVCNFVKASKFLRQHINLDDYIFIKMNCEGGEVLILQDLIDSDLISKIDFAYIDFDVRKIPSQQHKQKQIIKRLKSAGFNNFITNKRISVGINHDENTRIMLCASPNAAEFITLNKFDKRLNLLHKISPCLYRKFLRHRKRKYKQSIKNET